MEELIKAMDAALPTRRWLIALDRDGTLVPYAARPEQARVDNHLRDLLNALAQQSGFLVAVVSARSVAQLSGDFDRKRLILAGNYGFEVRFPDGRTVVQPQALRAVPYLKMARDEIASIIDLDSGAILEDHGYSLCLHYKDVPAWKADVIHRAVNQVSYDFPALKVRSLDTSYEVVPEMEWTKADALEFIERNIVGSEEQEGLFFYGGDSEADAPAFEWVARRQGISVRVGGSDSLGAQFHLPSPAALQKALAYLAQNRSHISAA